MRHTTGGVAHIAAAIEADLSRRPVFLHKPHIAALSDLAASALTCRSCNSSEWITILPRQVGQVKSKERYISRFLSNDLIEPVKVMKSLIVDVVEKISAQGQTLILMMDQSKICDGFECLMISVRMGNRAIPLAWKVVATQGTIGWDVQRPLLEEVLDCLPQEVAIMLAADRFYGTSSLVGWCQQKGWGYRIRLKGNLIMTQDDGEISTLDAANLKLTGLLDATFRHTNVSTHVGFLHEQGHKEPWIIAMDAQPSPHTVLDYGLRWGIECMFSDFKSRGFSVTTTHLRHTERIEKLLLVLAVAMIWAVSTGMYQSSISKTIASKKNTTDALSPGLNKG